MTSLPKKLADFMAECAVNGVALTLTYGTDGNFYAAPANGFYKSDGCVYVSCVGSKLWLKSRYNSETLLTNGFEGFVRESYDWWLFSRDRFEGWRDPASCWAALYAKYDLNVEEVA